MPLSVKKIINSFEACVQFFVISINLLKNPISLFVRDTPSFALYMVLYDIFINQTEDQKGFSLFWAGGLAGNLDL